jgi:hypothetical protein
MSILSGILSGGLGADARDYGIAHRPGEDGAPFHALDRQVATIYEDPASWYTGYPEWARTVKALALRVRGKPDARVTIYRAGPKPELNNGDWVSLTRGYAKQHLEAIGDPDDAVYTFEVPASSLLWPGDDLMEYGYFGPTVAAL